MSSLNGNLLIIILALSISNFSQAEDKDAGTIVFANILYRHGDRTPIRPYPNDPYNNESLWPVPYGQLTNRGKHQHLQLGRWLRKRYSHLLSNFYTPYDIYIQSTDVDRTLMSAESHLAGLYPPYGNQRWDNIQWMPIPVHTIPEDKDYVLAAKKYCPKYDYELEKVLNSAEMKHIDEENKNLYAYLTEKTGNNISSLRTVLQLYDTLFIENIYNKTLPEWTKSVFPDKLKPIADKSFTIEAYNKILQRLKSGSLLGEMIDHMEKKSRNSLIPDRKVWMYSAHDETLANMLMTLNLFDPHCPPYGAMILTELRRNSEDQYLVTVSYKNSSGKPVLLTIPGCTALCPLNELIVLTKDVIPLNWEKECAIGRDKFGYNVNTTTIIVTLTSSIMMLVLLILSIIGLIYWHYKREHNQYYLRLTTDPI
ncbi:prostatic acid phosphatase [Megalopta genalis]|uniref:prostatic acid phosphatase n=1 Tax=Megalopta genalis TaxID=115081 RepID=UPI0014430284|nr:prostatic acid phosphatase-like [Megalopta genalis]XP_033336660.1 prostatic acid phosphatase-like [Megalopta genalis]